MYIDTITSALQHDYDAIFDACNHEEKFAYEYLQSELFKKLPPDGDTSLADKAALDLFLSINASCLEKHLPLENYAAMTFLEIARGQLAHYSGNTVFWTLDEILQYVDLGSGANVKSHKSCNYSLKVANMVSGTQRQLRLLRAGNIKQRGRLGLSQTDFPVECSNLSFVPKTLEISRVIMTEPTAGMFLQKGLSGLICEVLLNYGIDMATQPDKNKELARLGSINGRYCTVDLRSASDSISVHENSVARYLLPERLWNWIIATRTGKTRLPDNTIIDLNMICGMGNGFCSSLQTLIFAAIVSACTNGRFGVFGDDMIFEDRYYERVANVLTSCGFNINTLKTFSSKSDRQGHIFRESCGGDFLNGVNVRPVQCKRLMDTVDFVILHNRLKLWDKSFPIPETLRVVKTLCKMDFVPDSFPETAGPWGEQSIERRLAITIKDTHGSEKSQVLGYSYVILEPEIDRARGKYLPDVGKYRFTGSYSSDLANLTDAQLFVAFIRGDFNESSFSFRTNNITFAKRVVVYPTRAYSTFLPFQKL